MAEEMRAAEYDRYGDASELQIRRVSAPTPGQDDLLVRVHASSVNPIDTIVRSGKLSFRTGRRFPKRTGIDFAGEVVSAPIASPFGIGDRVWGVMPLEVEKGLGQGSAADYVTVSVDRPALIPNSLDWAEAAAISSVGAVAIITLMDKAELKTGERLLVRGGAGGVGCMAIQLAKLIGAHITVLASADDLGFLTGLGADKALDYRETKVSDLASFDVILDLVGTDLSQYRKHLSRTGRMFCLAISGLPALIYIVASRLHGTRRVQFFSAAPLGDTMAMLSGLAEQGSIRPVIHSRFRLEDIAKAQLSIEAGGGRGKRVLCHTDDS